MCSVAPRFRLAFVFVAALALAVCAGARAETYVRLVDPREKVPLEYWVKDLQLPGGGVMYYRMPQKLYIDGRLVPFGQHGGGEGGLLGGEEKKDETGGIGEQIVADLGGGPAKEQEFKSDRATEVLSNLSVKAEAKAGLGVGEHVIEPGGVRFRLTEQGLAEVAPPLVKAGVESLQLQCWPVDFNVVPFTGGKGEVAVAVRSGAQTVLDETLRFEKPGAVRLYLPLSAEGYEVRIGGAQFRVTVGQEGVGLKGEPKLGDGVGVEAVGFAVSVFPKAAAQKAAAPAPAARPELYIFTDRSRQVFLEGERAEVSVRGFGAGDRPKEALLLLDAGGAATELGAVPLAQAGGVWSAEIELDTTLLRPGAYTLRARWGDAASNALPLEVSCAMPRTNMKLFSHLKWGPYSMAPEDMDRMADLGLNLLSEGLADTQGQTAHGAGCTPLEAWGARRETDESPVPAELRGRNCPPELLDAPLPHARATERMLARGVQFLPVLFSNQWMILYFNVGDLWQDQAEDRYQCTQHMGMELRRFPNFVGLNYATGDGPTPATQGHVFATAGVANFDVIHEERFQKLRALFEQKYGAIAVDTGGQEKLHEESEKDRREQAEHGLAWGFRVGEDVRMAVKGTDEKKLLWCQWVNDLYPEQFRNCRTALAAMMESPLVTSGSSWGPGAGGGMYPGTFYRFLDNPLNDFHGDFGVCNFSYITGTDIFGAGLEERPGRPWIGLDLINLRTSASGMKLLLEALSRNPDGIGVLNLQREFICPWAGQKQKSEELRLLTEIATRLGDTFRGLERVDEVAVVSSFRQEALEGQPFRALWAAHYIAQKAGWQADVVSDAFCEKHPEELARRCKAVFLFGMTAPFSAPMRQAMAGFQKAGGIIIADAKCKLDLPDVVKLPFEVPDSHGPSNMNDHLEFERFFAPHIEQFRAAVGPRLPSFFTMPASKFTGIRSRDGDLEYLTIFNDGKPPERPGMDGVAAQFFYQGDRATVRVARQGTLYDVLRQEVVKAAPDGDGMKFDLDMTHYPGSVFVLAPAPVVSLAVSCGRRAAPGETVVMTARALGADGAALAGRLPVEFTLLDPAGKIRGRACRTTNYEVRFKIAGNDPAGEWRWGVCELATGLRAEGGFAVGGERRAAAVRPRDELLYDAPAVHSTLHGKGVEVVLYPEQVALRGMAEELAAKLRERGVKATFRLIWPSDTRRYPMQWHYETIEDLEVRRGVLAGEMAGERFRGKNQFGTWKDDRVEFSTAFYGNYIASAQTVYYKDVILVGRGDVPSNPMLDVIARGQMLPRNVSPSFPAPGRGMVACAWGPFHYGHNAIVAYGRDEAGLSAAAGSLLRLAEMKEAPAPAAVPALRRTHAESGETYVSLGLGTAGDVATVTSAVRRAESVLPPVFPRKVVEAVADAQGRVCIAQEPLEEKGGPTLAVVRTADGSAAQYVPSPKLAPGDAESLSRYLARPPERGWPDRESLRTDAGHIVRAATGVGLFDGKADCAWLYDPFAVFHTYDEAKYPRVCRNWTLSADGRWMLASFYDITPGGDSDEMTINRPDVVLLDAQTGRAACVMEGFVGSRLALSGDGARAVVLDQWDPKRRDSRNPHGGPTLSLWVSGREQFHMPIRPPVDQFRVSVSGALAAISYDDARKRVTLVDLEKGVATELRSASIDVGLAVSADGGFALVSYADGSVLRVGRDGTVLCRTDLPCAGVPAIAPDGAARVACADGRVYALDSQGKVAAKWGYGDAPAEGLAPKVDAPAAGIERPEDAPFWTAMPGDSVQRLAAPLPGGAAEFKGEKKIALELPKRQRSDVFLLRFRYKLDAPEDELRVAAPADGGAAQTLRFRSHARPRWASVPLRSTGRVELTLQADPGATLSDVELVKLDLSNMLNVARTARPGQEAAGGEDNVPQVMVPNVIGLLGDPRCEQVAYGMSADGGRGWEKADLPPELRRAQTDRYAPFDGDFLTGTVLYPAVRRRGDLRSAQVLIELPKARAVSAIGVWEDPAGLPASAFALECCDKYEMDKMTKTPKADWRLVCAARGNEQYFHVHRFPPAKAKIWRYTIIETPDVAQRCAEIELMEEAMEGLMDLEIEGKGWQ